MKLFYKLLTLSLVALMASCGSVDDITFLQNYEEVNKINTAVTMYDARIMPKDILSISVNTVSEEASVPFNLHNRNNMGGGASDASMRQYLVNNDGTIDFPVLGRLDVVGLTKTECENLIKEKLKLYIKETPLVIVRMSSFTVTLMGEVGSSGQRTFNREKVNILEALASAGGISIYGNSKNVRLLREDANGHRHIYTIDVTDASVIYNPLYQLQQNDIVYVAPKKVKITNQVVNVNSSVWFTSISLLTSLTSVGFLIWNIVKK